MTFRVLIFFCLFFLWSVSSFCPNKIGTIVKQCTKGEVVCKPRPGSKQCPTFPGKVKYPDPARKKQCVYKCPVVNKKGPKPPKPPVPPPKPPKSKKPKKGKKGCMFGGKNIVNKNGKITSKSFGDSGSCYKVLKKKPKLTFLVNKCKPTTSICPKFEYAYKKTGKGAGTTTPVLFWRRPNKKNGKCYYKKNCKNKKKLTKKQIKAGGFNKYQKGFPAAMEEYYNYEDDDFYYDEDEDEDQNDAEDEDNADEDYDDYDEDEDYYDQDEDEDENDGYDDDDYDDYDENNQDYYDEDYDEGYDESYDEDNGGDYYDDNDHNDDYEEYDNYDDNEDQDNYDGYQ